MSDQGEQIKEVMRKSYGNKNPVRFFDESFIMPEVHIPLSSKYGRLFIPRPPRMKLTLDEYIQRRSVKVPYMYPYNKYMTRKNIFDAQRHSSDFKYIDKQMLIWQTNQVLGFGSNYVNLPINTIYGAMGNMDKDLRRRWEKTYNKLLLEHICYINQFRLRLI